MLTVATLSHVMAFFKLITEVGVIKTIVIGIVLLGLYFGVKFIGQYKFNKSAEKTGIKVSDESDLRFNALFTKGSYFLDYELPNIDVFADKPVRRQLVIDLLASYYSAILEGCTSIADIDMSKWSSEQWTIEMTRRFNAMLHTANAKCRTLGIPEVATSRFAKWTASSTDLLINYITTIGTSRAYSSNIVKTNTLFLIVNVLFYTMLGDAERSIHSLNGDITGTIYKGKAVEEVEH